MKRQALLFLWCTTAVLLLIRFAPVAPAQFTPPAFPGTFTDIATPSSNPPSGATKAYTKNGTVCGLSPTGTETCTGTGGATVSVATPYLVVGGSKYVAETLWPFTAFFSGSFLDANTCSLTGGANGSEQLSCALATANAWYSVAATTSIEAEFEGIAATNGINTIGPSAGIWMCDTTNGKLYNIEAVDVGSNTTLDKHYYQLVSWTLAGCAGTPSAPSVLSSVATLSFGLHHLKMSKVGGNLISQVSQDGGQTYIQLTSSAVGTLAKAGVDVRTNSTMTATATFLSVAVQ